MSEHPSSEKAKHGGPPAARPSGGPPASQPYQSYGAPPSYGFAPSPAGPYGAGGSAPPYGAGGSAPPYGTGGAAQPYGAGGSAPPYGAGGSAPPYGAGGAAQPYGAGGSAPLYGAGGSAPPYGAGGAAQPYGAGGSAPPYGAGGSAPPYGAGGAAQPYGAGGSAPPYGAVGAAQPYGAVGASGYGHPPQAGGASGYGQPQQAYGSFSPFAQLTPSVFPPGTDPNVVGCFKAADQDGSGFIDDKELQGALSTYNQSFSMRTVHLLMYLFTGTNVRRIGPKEFSSLFHGLQNWRATFECYDRDRSGKIDSNELREALLSLGFAVSPVILDLLISKFDKTGGRAKAVEYDNFIECCLIVKGLTEKFKEKDSSLTGSAYFTYETFMMTVLPFIVA